MIHTVLAIRKTTEKKLHVSRHNGRGNPLKCNSWRGVTTWSGSQRVYVKCAYWPLSRFASWKSSKINWEFLEQAEDRTGWKDVGLLIRLPSSNSFQDMSCGSQRYRTRSPVSGLLMSCPSCRVGFKQQSRKLSLLNIIWTDNFVANFRFSKMNIKSFFLFKTSLVVLNVDTFWI